MTGAARTNSPQRVACGDPTTARSSPEPALIDRILFYVLLVVLSTRPLLSETFEPVQVSFLAALQAEAGPTPATTAGLDAVLLGASVLTLARGGRWRHRGVIAVGVALLFAAAVVSSFVAGDKPVARLAGGSLVTGVLAGVALTTLVRRRWMLALLLSALLATGVTTAIKCLSQHWYENPLTQQRWASVYKPELIRQGFDPQDPLFVNFERRMLAGEVHGFLGHPNVTASCLLMWLMPAAGLLAVALLRIAGRRAARSAADARPGQPWGMLAAGVLLCVGLAAALFLTGSRGAMVAAACALPLFVLLGAAASWCARHARALWAALIVGYVAVIAAGVGHGLRAGTLPHPSLAFRWYYWSAAGRVWQDAPLSGVGRENFAAAYLRYKPAEGTEEVRNPHDLWLSLLVEMGPLGLAGGVLLCGALLLTGLRALVPHTVSEHFASACGGRPPGRTVRTGAPSTADQEFGRDENPKTALEPPSDGLRAAYAAPVAAGVLLLHALSARPALGEPGALFAWGQEIALAWLLALIVCAWLLGESGAVRTEARWLIAGCWAALAGALVHGLIDFALLTSAGLSVFVLCAAGLVASRQVAQGAAHVSPSARSSVIAGTTAAAIVLLHFAVVLRPAVGASAAVTRLNAALRTAGTRAEASAALDQAAQCAREYRGTSAARAALRAMLQLGRHPGLLAEERRDWLAAARARAAENCAANPHDTSNYALLATIEAELADCHEHAGDTANAAQFRRLAAETWDRAVELYPTNPRARISAGQAWLAVWRSDGSAQAGTRAREHFAAALQIDDSRPPEEVMRLRPPERALIDDGLRTLAAAASPASQPTP